MLICKYVNYKNCRWGVCLREQNLPRHIIGSSGLNVPSVIVNRQLIYSGLILLVYLYIVDFGAIGID